MFIDLDEFKAINESFGHEVGDQQAGFADTILHALDDEYPCAQLHDHSRLLGERNERQRKSFVDSVHTSSPKLTEAIVGIAEGLHLAIVAESVEEIGQLAVLRSLNCDSAQGFLISRPLPAADMTALLGRHERADAA